MLNYGKSHWRTLESGLQKEWLATNGIGGYASSTLINLNSRKYHGLLVAAHNPPGRRLLHLAKLDERFRAGSCTFNLAANENSRFGKPASSPPAGPGGALSNSYIQLQRHIPGQDFFLVHGETVL